jgi:DNA-binding NarL/FixJ family response regulator
VRVVVADDSVLLREGVLRILTTDGLTASGVGDAAALLDHVAAQAPELAIVDIRMPPSFTDEGLRAARAIRTRHPATAVLLLSQHVQVGGALDLFVDDTGGGLGYLLKDRIIEIDDFLDAVRRVARGGSVLDPIVVRALIQRRSPADPLARLSDREREVLALMAHGLSNHGIAARLVLSLRTVESHVASVFTGLGLLPAQDEHRRVQAVVTYLKGER